MKLFSDFIEKIPAKYYGFKDIWAEDSTLNVICTFLEVNTIPVCIPSGSEIHLTTCLVTFIIKLGSHQTEINSDLFRPEDNNEGSNPNSISGLVTSFLRTHMIFQVFS